MLMELCAFHPHVREEGVAIEFDAIYFDHLDTILYQTCTVGCAIILKWHRNIPDILASSFRTQIEVESERTV